MTTYAASVYGALVVMCLLASLFFLRYWQLCKDRFFIWFACAFATFGLSWGLLVYDAGVSEHTFAIYAIRLLGFMQIIAAILLKNRNPSG